MYFLTFSLLGAQSDRPCCPLKHLLTFHSGQICSCRESQALTRDERLKQQLPTCQREMEGGSLWGGVVKKSEFEKDMTGRKVSNIYNHISLKVRMLYSPEMRIHVCENRLSHKISFTPQCRIVLSFCSSVA